MKKLLFFIGLVMIGLLSSMAVAAAGTFTFNTSRLTPAAYNIFTTTNVLFNWTVTNNIPNATSTLCSVYNASSTQAAGANNFTALVGATNVNVTNSTGFRNITVSMSEMRTWWKVNCRYDSLVSGDTNVSVNTSVRIFDIDTDYYTLSLGAGQVINFTLDRGDIIAAGNITGKYINGTIVGPIDTGSDVLIGGGFDSGGITLTTGGSGFFDDSILLRGNLTLVNDAVVNGSMNPFIDAFYSLGNSTRRWLNGFINSITAVYVNASIINATNMTASIITSDTFIGDLIGNVTGTSTNTTFADYAGNATWSITSETSHNSSFSINTSNSTFSRSSGNSTYSNKAGNATYSISSGNSTYAEQAGTILGNLTPEQVQIFVKSFMNVGSQSGNATASRWDESVNITGDSDSIMTSISGMILTIRNAVIDKVTTAFTNKIDAQGGLNSTNMNITTIIVSQNATFSANLSVGTWKISTNATDFTISG